jgi:hypothetical protein
MSQTRLNRWSDIIDTTGSRSKNWSVKGKAQWLAHLFHMLPLKIYFHSLFGRLVVMNVSILNRQPLSLPLGEDLGVTFHLKKICSFF